MSKALWKGHNEDACVPKKKKLEKKHTCLVGREHVRHALRLGAQVLGVEVIWGYYVRLGANDVYAHLVRRHTSAHVSVRQHTSARFGAHDIYVHLVHRNTLTNTLSAGDLTKNDDGANNREKKIPRKIAKLQQCAREDRQAPRVKFAI